MHDDYIESYSVNIEKGTIKIQTYNYEKTITTEILFDGVLTHEFNCILECNILYGIDCYEVGIFIEHKSDKLNKMKKSCWPIHYDSIDNLKEFLVENHYHYYIISSSLGMDGWVLAKSLKVTERPYCK